jgi:hypothetical protein
MARIQLKFWMAPGAELEEKLAEGELAIREEDGVLVRRPDGQPTAPLEIVGNYPRATAETPGSIIPGDGVLIDEQGRLSIDPNFAASTVEDISVMMAIALG